MAAAWAEGGSASRRPSRPRSEQFSHRARVNDGITTTWRTDDGRQLTFVDRPGEPGVLLAERVAVMEARADGPWVLTSYSTPGAILSDMDGRPGGRPYEPVLFKRRGLDERHLAPELRA